MVLVHSSVTSGDQVLSSLPHRAQAMMQPSAVGQVQGQFVWSGKPLAVPHQSVREGTEFVTVVQPVVRTHHVDINSLRPTLAKSIPSRTLQRVCAQGVQVATALDEEAQHVDFQGASGHIQSGPQVCQMQSVGAAARVSEPTRSAPPSCAPAQVSLISASQIASMQQKSGEAEKDWNSSDSRPVDGFEVPRPSFPTPFEHTLQVRSSPQRVHFLHDGGRIHDLPRPSRCVRTEVEYKAHDDCCGDERHRCPSRTRVRSVSQQPLVCNKPEMDDVLQRNHEPQLFGARACSSREGSLVHPRDSRDSIPNEPGTASSSGSAFRRDTRNMGLQHETLLQEHNAVVFDGKASEAHTLSHQHRKYRAPSKSCSRASLSGQHPNARSLVSRAGSATHNLLADADNLCDVHVDNAEHLRKKVECLRKTKHALASHVLLLKEHHGNLQKELANYQNLHELARGDFRGTRGLEVDRLEVDNLHQKLDAILMLKDMLFQENIGLQRELDTLMHSAGEGMKPSACVICMDNLANIVCMPCKHLALCTYCSWQEAVDNCPICRTSIQEKMLIYTP